MSDLAASPMGEPDKRKSLRAFLRRGVDLLAYRLLLAWERRKLAVSEFFHEPTPLSKTKRGGWAGSGSGSGKVPKGLGHE